MKKGILFTVLVFSFLASAFSADYVIAAEKFEYTRGQTLNAVTDATSELIPQQILENINTQLMRSVLPDEQLERSRYQSRQERYSLYLQLSSEYKKRDNLVLEKYSDKELQKQIEAQNKKIKEIEDKIQKNLDDQKKAEQELEEKLAAFTDGTYTLENTDKTELQKYSSFFRNLFINNESLVSMEKIKYYKDDATSLYKPNKNAKDAGYTSAVFEKEIVAAKVNALITGKITSYDDYYFVTVQAYTYPGAKLIGSVTEVGSKNEMEFICANIARLLVPVLTNSMKISVCFEVLPKEANYQVFVDDSLQNINSENLILDSGVHRIQIVADGYKSIATSYYFEGNEFYKIQTILQEEEIKTLKLTLLNPVYGTVYANSIPGVERENKVSEIKINGDSVLGNFHSEDGLTAFYYIPPQKLNTNELLYINASLQDKDKYIDTRRKWMYAGYSALMVSLIPMFYTDGQRQKYANMYHSKYATYEEAKTWENVWIGCCAVSIAAGVFWGYELVRYLVAANSVIPETPKIDKNGNLAKKQQKNILRAEKKQKNENVKNPVEPETETKVEIETETEIEKIENTEEAGE